MNSASLVEQLRPLPRERQVRLAAQIERLQRVCSDNQPLELFYQETLDVLLRIFGAAAGSLWISAGGRETLRAVARSGFAGGGLPVGAEPVLDTLVSGGWDRSEPSAEVFAGAEGIVLVGPIRELCQPLGEASLGAVSLGAVQLVVLKDGLRGMVESELEAVLAVYRRALMSVLGLVQPAIRRRLTTRSITLSTATEGLEQLNQQIAGVQRTIRTAIERYLQQFAGVTFGSLDLNQQFVRSTQQLLDRNGLRVRCPECGHPAILRCSRNASIPGGVFVFDHYLPEGRTFHGGSRTLPLMKTVAKPVRRTTS